MKFEITKLFSIAIAGFLGSSPAHARIVGGVQNKNQDNARKTPRVYNPQQSQRTSSSQYSSARKFSPNKSNSNRSNSSSNKRSNSNKNKSNQRSNSAVSTQRVIPRVNTNSTSIPSRTSVMTRQSNSSNKNSNNRNKSNNKASSKVATAPAPRVIPRVNTNPAPAKSTQSRVVPRVNSNTVHAPKPNQLVRQNSSPQSNRKYTRPVAHTNTTHKDARYSHLRMVGAGVSPSVVSKKWNSNQYQRASVWDRVHKHSGHEHHADYHHNFSNSLNYAYRPSAWGSNPWWDQHDRHDYHKGCWDYGWNDHYSHRHSLDRNFYPPGYSRPSSSLFNKLAWGLAGWGLGSVAYDIGYNTYSNPYSAPPVSYRGMSYSYAEPIAVEAASRAPEPELHVTTKEQLSVSAMENAREYFEQGDYVSSLQEVDQAIAFTPSDPILHEFRALNLFALGRYGDAAGVLNPILASGPGWDWDTLIGFYASEDVYTQQLRRLEGYVDTNVNSADSRFLLGYHYMAGGYLAEAREMFDQASQIEPNDSVAAQLRNLAASSMPVEEAGEESEPLGEMPDEEILVGTWRALSGDGKTITLTIGESGDFNWDYEGAAEGAALTGEWSVDENGLLVLNDEDVQLAGIIEMDGTNTMHFVLAGTPDGDPGLTFERM